MSRSHLLASILGLLASGAFACSSDSVAGSAASSHAADTVSCGQRGQTCCTNNVCSDGLQCFAAGDGLDDLTVCDDAIPPSPPPTCGQIGLPCCQDIHECAGSAVCNDQSVCAAPAPDSDAQAPCGGEGQVCCFTGGSPCSGSLVCNGDDFVCGAPFADAGAGASPGDGACGQSGQVCCGTNTCSDGLECFQLGDGFDGNDTCAMATPPPPPPTCGELGQPCCQDIHECAGSLVCDDQSICSTPAPDSGAQAPCGGLGQVCCFGGGPACTGSLACNGEQFICTAP